MKEAFVYIFKDNCLFQKTWIYLLLLIILNFLGSFLESDSHMVARPELFSTNPTMNLLVAIAGVLICIAVIGYRLSVTGAIIKQKNNILLPKFNFINNFIKGLKYIVAMSLILLCYLVIFKTIQIFTGFIIYPIAILIILFYMIYGTAFYRNFADTNNLFAFFNFKKIFNDVAFAPKLYFKHLSMLILISLFQLILNFITGFLTSFIPSNAVCIIVFSIVIGGAVWYLDLVSAFIIAKSLKTDSVV